MAKNNLLQRLCQWALLLLLRGVFLFRFVQLKNKSFARVCLNGHEEYLLWVERLWRNGWINRVKIDPWMRLTRLTYRRSFGIGIGGQ